LKKGNNRGFSLMELLVVMAVTTVVIATVYVSYSGQQESRLSQKQVVEMQQNIRGVLYVMTMEIRMAGYDPYQSYDAGITSAGDGSNGSPLTFSFVEDDDGEDNDNDLTVDEEGELKTISFQLYDAYSDGDNDIGRKVGNGNYQAIAENIEDFQLTYMDEDGESTSDIDEIKAIKIEITSKVDDDTIDYTLENATRSVSTIVKCRNMNL